MSTESEASDTPLAHQSTASISATYPASRIKKIISRLTIGHKIGCGYALSLGIAILGTTAGFIVGDYYQRKAEHGAKHAQEEVYLLHRLQAGVLQARTHQQQFIPLLPTPEDLQAEYSHFQSHIAEVNKVWTDIELFSTDAIHTAEAHTSGIPAFLKTYAGVTTAYAQQIEAVLKQINPATLQASKLEAAQKQLLNFTNSSLALEFDGISDDLSDLIKVAYQERDAATLAVTTAETLRLQIIIGSMLLSVALAVLLAIYTSRAIAQPIKEVTEIAQRTTQESNFGLQAPVTTEDEIGVLATSFNQLIQRVKTLLEEQQAAAAHQQKLQEQQLIQSEKMSSLGRMLAGVAHEINNPVNFIYGNLAHANEYVEDLMTLLESYEAEHSSPSKLLQAQAEEMDVDFLREDLPKLLQSMQVGADRARQIVLSLKNFSRLDDATVHSVDLHACLDSTLLILNNRIKKGITVTQRYGDIPLIEGYSGLLYQVFMNVISNGIDALEDQLETAASSREIVITTERLNHDSVAVRIADNGPGIPPEHQLKIFDTFFTTKPQGIGTGLGLSITHQIVVEKHGGRITFTSAVGQGTEFAIVLPIKHAAKPDLVSQPTVLVGADT